MGQKCLLGVAMASWVLAGCVTPVQTDFTRLQGTWQGKMVGNEPAGETTVTYSGTNLEVRSSNTNVWYQATFTLREDKNPKQLVAVITNCPFPQLEGQTAHAIYQFEQENLRMAARQPGDETPLTGFGDSTASEFLMRKVR